MSTSVRHVIALALGAIVILVFVAVQAQAVDLQQHARYQADLLQLNELDARLNAGVLESKFELTTSFDTLVASSATLRAVQADLAQPPDFIGADGEHQLQSYLEAYQQAADDKQQLIERFKTNDAVYRNSVHYLPVLYDEINANSAADGLDRETMDLVDKIVRGALLFNLTGDADDARDVTSQLNRLQWKINPASASASDRRLRLFSTHVAEILQRKSSLDSIEQQLVSVPTRQRAEDLQAEYSRQYERALATADTFRTILITAALLLLACTVYILGKWRRVTDALRYQARHDSLTGLANRTLLQLRLGEATRLAERNGSSVALLLMDLDRFKEVNDTLGHHAGDELLRRVAQRLRDALRPTDTVARLGGDEFAVLLPDADEQQAIEIASGLLTKLQEPCTIDGRTIDLEASVGIAVAPSHGDDAQAMLRRADVAMYIAKADHSGYALYTPDQDMNNTDRLGMLAELRYAIEHDQLMLHYQPKLDAETDQLAGVEALVRWQHPERGLVPASEFIPLAEQTGLIDPLTRWVLEQSLRQCASWLADGIQVPIAVNLSVRSLQDPGLPATVARMVANSGVPPQWLTLEITESAVMADPTRALATLGHLRATGVRVAIDDFGTGYSSLAYLRQIPADDLKIDQSFTRSMLTNPTGRAIVRSVIDLGHSLGLRVTAEGVEDEATLRALADLSCDEAQGYHIARPLTPDMLAAWLETRSGDLAAAA